MYIPTLVHQTPANKSEEDEQSGQESRDYGAYKNTNNSTVTGMLQKVLILLRGGFFPLVGHGH